MSDESDIVMGLASLVGKSIGKSSSNGEPARDHWEPRLRELERLPSRLHLEGLAQAFEYGLV